MAKLLVVEDDSNLLETICHRLKADRHSVEFTEDGQSALQLMRSFPFDLVILDWNLPAMTGVEVLKQYRSSGGLARILMLTGNKAIEEKEFGFSAGADDYLTKPFHMKELVLRVNALLRRPQSIESDVLEVGSLVLRRKDFKVSRGGVNLPLTAKEFALLEFFMRHPNHVFSSEALLDRVWHSDASVSVDSVKALVHRLRSKLMQEEGTPTIVTVFGRGYKLEVPS